MWQPLDHAIFFVCFWGAGWGGGGEWPSPQLHCNKTNGSIGLSHCTLWRKRMTQDCLCILSAWLGPYFPSWKALVVSLWLIAYSFFLPQKPELTHQCSVWGKIIPTIGTCLLRIHLDFLNLYPFPYCCYYIIINIIMIIIIIIMTFFYRHSAKKNDKSGDNDGEVATEVSHHEMRWSPKEEPSG